MDRPTRTGSEIATPETSSVHASIAVGIVVAALIFLWHVAALVSLVRTETLAPLLVGAVLGALAADLVSGVVHWGFDTWGTSRERGLLARLVRDFRAHHREPRAMVRGDWIDVNGESAIAVGSVLAVASLAGVPGRLAEAPGSYAALLVWAGLSGAANQIHYWAHHPKPPAAVRLLQRCRLILPPRQHALHHTKAHRQAYCIALGWLDALLDGLGAWRRIERVIERTTGLRPQWQNDIGRRKDHGWSS